MCVVSVQSPCLWVCCSTCRLLRLLCLYADCSGGAVSVGIDLRSAIVSGHIMALCCFAAIFLLIGNGVFRFACWWMLVGGVPFVGPELLLL